MSCAVLSYAAKAQCWLVAPCALESTQIGHASGTKQEPCMRHVLACRQRAAKGKPGRRNSSRTLDDDDYDPEAEGLPDQPLSSTLAHCSGTTFCLCVCPYGWPHMHFCLACEKQPGLLNPSVRLLCGK